MASESSSVASLQRGLDSNVESVILDAVRSLRFGSVEVTIHNAKVVQVERKEKLRFTPRPEA